MSPSTVAINIGRLMQTKLCHQSNTTYCILDASILIAAELTSGIIVSCAPMMGPIFFRNRVGTYDQNPRAIRTIGSTARTWQRRRMKSTSLLVSQDDDLGIVDKQLSYRTHIVSPERFHHPSPGSQGIMVQNEMSVMKSSAPERKI
ncbi:hypothetical protein N7520_003301 [Penicillium odoratum]|uniref:uncharacterized protein n=1 Tax=Penicillium odoratum TaxID=1167516 RepID=UPI0025474A03|nr:uncharacterized protein N7520_003301 [Penicillium odoratum]KAJ5768742.1 hypothetical protein N7520_003301 [Penicillium odoratum]